MKTHYAEAIRRGIEAANRTRYGQEDDPFYEERSQLVWSFGFMAGDAKLRGLAIRAFERRTHVLRRRAIAEMTPEQRADAREVFRIRYERFQETPEERQYRLLRESIEQLAERLEKCDLETQP